MKKLFAFLLACLMLVGVLASCGGDTPNGDGTSAADTTTLPPADDDSAGTGNPNGDTTTAAPDDNTEINDTNFVPAFRFVVASDTHLKDEGDIEDQRWAKLFETAYAYSEGHAVYQELDGIFVVGDCVDKGTQEQMNRFFEIASDGLKEGTVLLASLGNHEYYTTKYIEGLSKAEIYDKTVEWFTNASGLDEVDYHTVIDGYHFIMVSPDASHGWDFSEEKQIWLAKELQSAAADDPTGMKPIFVFQHEPNKNTVLGSGGGVTTLKNILNKYPQVVNFAGHSHFPLNDPRSIHQEYFTSLGTGSMKYYSYEFAGVTLPDVPNATDWDGGWAYLTDATVFKDGGAYYIVEIGQNDVIRVQGYDVNGEGFNMDPLFIEVGDTSKFTYTNDREDTAELPYFEEGAAIEVTACEFSGATLKFPQAKCADYVQYYRYEVYRGETLLDTQYILSGNAYYPAPETKTVTVNMLSPGTEYTVKVIPVNTWAQEGEVLEQTFTTKTVDISNVDLPKADVFEAVFAQNGACDWVTGSDLQTSKNPTTEYNDTIGDYVGVFKDGGNYLFPDFAKKYELIRDAVTFEAYIRIDQLPSGGYVCPFSNQQSGGLGFSISPDGTLQFAIHLNGAYQSVTGTVRAGEFVHIVGVYDGAAVKLYINGTLVDETAASGKMQLPNANAQYLCVGADSQPSMVGDAPFTGAIAQAKVYSSALTETEIQALYISYNS